MAQSHLRFTQLLRLGEPFLALLLPPASLGKVMFSSVCPPEEGGVSHIRPGDVPPLRVTSGGGNRN